MRFSDWALLLLLWVEVHGCHSLVQAVYVFILPFATCQASLLLAEELERVAVEGLGQEALALV
jgi:hypothetical protein